MTASMFCVKSAIRHCRNAEEVQTEVRRISENAVTKKPKEKLRCRPVRAPKARLVKVFHPWNGRRDWQQS